MAKQITCPAGSDWKTFVTKNFAQYDCIQIEDRDVSAEEVYEFMKQFKPRNKSWVVVWCYRRPEIWKKSSAAKDFYLEGMSACEGSEQERYSNIFIDLNNGYRICSDEEV